MSNEVFPTLPGLEFPVKKRPNFSTEVQRSVSGREVSAAFMSLPIWDWELSFSVLRESESEFQTLAGFFLKRMGRFDTFLFNDPGDNVATSEVLGTGDGTTKTFQLKRAFGGFVEPVFDLNGAALIYDNAVLKTSPTHYSINASGLVTFVTAPIAGHALTWSGAYYWRVRFMDDSTDFDNFMSKLWGAGSVAFSTARL